jgi:hypothetical protein
MPSAILSLIQNISLASDNPRTAFFPESLTDTIFPYLNHNTSTLRTLAFGAIASFAATSPQHATLLLEKGIVVHVLSYFEKLQGLQQECVGALRLSAILSLVLDGPPLHPAFPFVVAYVSGRFVPDHRKWSTFTVCHALMREDSIDWLLNFGVIDILINAHKLFNSVQLPLLYRAFEILIRHGLADRLGERDEWHEVLHKLLNSKMDKLVRQDGGFANVCTVISLMSERCAYRLFATGIIDEIIRVAEEERSDWRESAAACLSHVLLVAPWEVCHYISEIGGLSNICEIVGQARPPALHAMLEAIPSWASEDQRCLELVQQSAVGSLPEDIDPETGCQDLVLALMNVVFPASGQSTFLLS